jgi:hypothetical protein
MSCAGAVLGRQGGAGKPDDVTGCQSVTGRGGAGDNEVVVVTRPVGTMNGMPSAGGVGQRFGGTSGIISGRFCAAPGTNRTLMSLSASYTRWSGVVNRTRMRTFYTTGKTFHGNVNV